MDAELTKQVRKRFNRKVINLVLLVVLFLSLGTTVSLFILKPSLISEQKLQLVSQLLDPKDLEVIDDSKSVEFFWAGASNEKETLLLGHPQKGDIIRFKNGRYEKIPNATITSVNKNSLLASDGKDWLIGNTFGKLYHLGGNSLNDLSKFLPQPFGKIGAITYIPEAKKWIIFGYPPGSPEILVYSTDSPFDKARYIDLSSKLSGNIQSYEFAVWNGENLLIGDRQLILADENLDSVKKLNHPESHALLSAVWTNDRFIVVGETKIFETTGSTGYNDLSSKINVSNGFRSMASNGTTLYLNSGYGLVSYDGENIVNIRQYLKNFEGRVQTVVASDTNIFVGGEGGAYVNRIVVGMGGKYAFGKPTVIPKFTIEAPPKPTTPEGTPLMNTIYLGKFEEKDAIFVTNERLNIYYDGKGDAEHDFFLGYLVLSNKTGRSPFDFRKLTEQKMIYTFSDQIDYPNSFVLDNSRKNLYVSIDFFGDQPDNYPNIIRKVLQSNLDDNTSKELCAERITYEHLCGSVKEILEGNYLILGSHKGCHGCDASGVPDDTIILNTISKAIKNLGEIGSVRIDPGLNKVFYQKLNQFKVPCNEPGTPGCGSDGYTIVYKPSGPTYSAPLP